MLRSLSRTSHTRSFFATTLVCTSALGSTTPFHLFFSRAFCFLLHTGRCEDKGRAAEARRGDHRAPEAAAAGVQRGRHGERYTLVKAFLAWNLRYSSESEPALRYATMGSFGLVLQIRLHCGL